MAGKEGRRREYNCKGTARKGCVVTTQFGILSSSYMKLHVNKIAQNYLYTYMQKSAGESE